MELTILSEHFKVVDTKEKITIADSFVFPQNKIGSGNGEAKLYIGQDNKDTRELFGGSGFNRCKAYSIAPIPENIVATFIALPF